MPNLKISALTGGGAAQAGDEYVVARSGGNNKITGANVAAAATSVGTLTSLTVSGQITANGGVEIRNGSFAAGRIYQDGGLGLVTAALSGSTNDWTLVNPSGANIIAKVATGSTTFEIISNATVGGNLGLGVTPSAWSGGRAIEVGVLGNCLWGFGANELYQMSNAYFNAGFKYAAAGTATQYLQYNGAHAWYTAPSGTAGNAITFTQAMTLDANGLLGVGTTSPSFRLHAQVASGADRDIFIAGVGGASNGFTVKWNHANTNTYVAIANIPTSSAGLPAGTLWNDGGTIKIA